jgi:hypothetical protein
MPSKKDLNVGGQSGGRVFLAISKDKSAIVELKRLKNEGHRFEPKAKTWRMPGIMDEGSQPS